MPQRAPVDSKLDSNKIAPPAISLPRGGEYRCQGSQDDRFVDYFGAIQSVVTGSGNNDSGLLETNLRDERLLPFEGAGAESTWDAATTDLVDKNKQAFAVTIAPDAPGPTQVLTRTAFQFRNTGAGPLHILTATMPPWPGPQEATEAEGKWPGGAGQGE